MDLFRDGEDFIFFLKCIKNCRIQNEFKIYAICLMTNHFHIIIHDNAMDLPILMDTIESVYARYFNEKYKHKGSIYDGRFESRLVNTDMGFLKLYRYIIRNPIVAGMTDNIYEYPWVTVTKSHDRFDLIEFSYVNDAFKRICRIRYEEFLQSNEDDLWEDEIEVCRMEYDKAVLVFERILAELSGQQYFNQANIDKETQKRIIYMTWSRGVTIKQLTQITGLSTKTIRKLKDP